MAGSERNCFDSSQNHNDGNINTKDFLLGALVGGIVGSLAALMLAPKSGRELRSDLNSGAYQLREKTDHLRDTAVVKSNEIASTVKDKTAAISKTVAKQSTELVSKVKGLKGQKSEELSDEENPVDQLFDQDLQSDIQQKLDETKRAFDDTESKINH